jgi:hypothetical protein
MHNSLDTKTQCVRIPKINPSWMLFLVTLMLVRPASGVGNPSPPNVKPEFQRFFRYYKPGRSLPASVLHAHGINDEQVGRSYALIAGVSNYPKLPADKASLQPAKHDIDNLVAFLRDRQFFDEIIVIEDSDVSLNNFNYFLQVYLPKEMGDRHNARFLFAYSGHGFDDGGSSYILADTASSMSDVSSGIDLFQLKIAIEKVVSRALNSIVLINSCQGGAFLDRIPFGENRLLLATFGAHAITAGAKGQFTYGSGAENKGSYFFDEVIAGLSGAADLDGGGLITADQLYSFVKSEVQRDTNSDQNPQFGDIAPHTSNGSFFFVDPRPSPTAVTSLTVSEVKSSEVFRNTPERSCDFDLFSDYYAYGLKNNLQDDLLKIVDLDDWRSLQSAAGTSSAFFSGGRAFLGGAFPVTDDYATFDQKRAAHFKTVFYDRNIQQATEAMQLTVGDRLYTAFGECLRRQRTGPALRAWASRETIDEIELHVKYVGVAGANKIEVTGSLTGGSVLGSPQGSISEKPILLHTGEERGITINRASTDSEVHVILTTKSALPPVVLTYKRADGILSVHMTGTGEVLREANHRVEAHTPNNNENRGNCPNEVGHHEGEYCTSRTTLTLSSLTPRFLKNARVECFGDGCPWTQMSAPTFTPDQSSVSAFVDNWGSDVQVSLVVDEYERVSGQECGSTGSIPTVNGRSVVLAVPRDCAPFAAVKWVKIPGFAEGIVPFGNQSTDGTILMNGSAIKSEATIIASYSLVGSKTHPELPDPRDSHTLATGTLDYQSLFDKAKLNELELANLGEAAFSRRDYDWTIRFLEQARLVQHSKVWMRSYPYLAASYVLANNDTAQFEKTLEDMLAAMTVPATYLYHAYPRSLVINRLNAVLALVPSGEQSFLRDVISRAGTLTTS